ncbi:MAG TPA: ASCH domain-containing protein [Arenicellales bacterium]|nr:ASCH domain-containing protein [Arenicellales bacterium]
MDLSTASKEVRAFWKDFGASVPDDPSRRFYEAFHFADSEAVADELAQLVLAGTKQATASLRWMYEYERQPLPAVGGLSVVTFWSGEPVCVIETRKVEIVPFNEVTPEFARIEGEGDRSLEYWRKAHWEFFIAECAQAGRRPSPDMEVVCEQFAVVYRRDCGTV